MIPAFECIDITKSLSYLIPVVNSKAYRNIVQSLNSPFFPPHIGAEPGRAERRVSFFRPLGFSPYMGREERRFQGLD